MTGHVFEIAQASIQTIGPFGIFTMSKTRRPLVSSRWVFFFDFLLGRDRAVTVIQIQKS